MLENVYSDPAHNLNCSYRFTCGAAKCPEITITEEVPSCHIDKFKRYQPDNGNCWYYRSWEEVNRITWWEVFSLKEAWIYILLLIIIAVFIFILLTLIKVVLIIN